MKKSLKAILLSVVTVFSLSLTACSPPSANDAAAESGQAPNQTENTGTDTLHVGMVTAPTSQNPFNTASTGSDWTVKYYYDTLLDQVGPTEFQPRLGKLETEDNQNYTVTVHPDAHWADDKPVTAEDVAFTLNTIAHPDTLTNKGAKVAMLEGTDEGGKLTEGEELPSVEVVDDKTLTFKTKKTMDPNYVSEFLGTGVLVAPKHVFESVPKADLHTSEEALNPTVTSGAFEFVEYKEENYLHLTANEDYYRGAPQLSDIYFRVLNGSTFVSELQAGNLHMLTGGGFGDLPHNDVQMVQDIEGMVVEKHASPNMQYLSINHEDPQFSHPKVRQALAYALDFDATVANLLHGNGEVPAGPYSSASGYQNESLEPYPYDPEKAKSLLEEANFDFNQSVEVAVPLGNVVREQNADLIEQQLEAAGMDVTQTTYDYATFSSYLTEGKFQLAMDGFAHTYDPDISNFVGSTGVENQMNYSSSKMDDLLVEGIETASEEERQEVYQEVQKLFQEDVPVVPLYSESIYVVQSDKVNGGIQGFHPASLANLHEWSLSE